MTRSEKRKVRQTLDALNTALQMSQKAAADTLALLVETKALADRAQANADVWRGLYENKPVVYTFPAETFYRPRLKPQNDLVH
jgi:hypothetical protein